jgi:glutathione S-transferase
MQIPYHTVEVNPLTKKQLQWSDYRKVPVALLDGEAVADSTAIITRLAAELDGQKKQQITQSQHRQYPFWRLVLTGSRRREVHAHLSLPFSHNAILHGVNKSCEVQSILLSLRWNHILRSLTRKYAAE